MKLFHILFVLVVSHETVEAQNQLQPFEVEHMTRGYFYASSIGPDALKGHGGWGGSDNPSIPFTPSAHAEGLEITVDTLHIVPFDSIFQGRSVEVRNNGPDTLFFPAQDSRVYLKTQAMHKGKFEDIEYLPSSWCGNSYHTLYLAPSEKWVFVMPKYDGPNSTELRLELTYRSSTIYKDTLVQFSHLFPGGVHSKQFTKKLDHDPAGLMDPYNDQAPLLAMCRASVPAHEDKPRVAWWGNFDQWIRH